MLHGKNQDKKNSLFHPKLQKVQFPRPIRTKRRKIRGWGEEEEEEEVEEERKEEIKVSLHPKHLFSGILVCLTISQILRRRL